MTPSLFRTPHPDRPAGSQVYACRYGTFLGNCEADRAADETRLKPSGPLPRVLPNCGSPDCSGGAGPYRTIKSPYKPSPSPTLLPISNPGSPPSRTSLSTHRIPCNPLLCWKPSPPPHAPRGGGAFCGGGRGAVGDVLVLDGPTGVCGAGARPAPGASHRPAPPPRSHVQPFMKFKVSASKVYLRF